MACGAFCTTPIISLQVETCTLPLSYHRHELVIKTYLSLRNKPQHINYYRTFFSPITHKNKNPPLGERSRRYLLDYEIEEEALKTMTARQTSQYLSQKLQAKFQTYWNSQTSKKLYQLKPLIERWETSNRHSRKEECILCRVRIGHTQLTHQPFLQDQVAPKCDSCAEASLTVRHILNDCPKFQDDRINVYGGSPFPVYETLVDSEEAVQQLFKYLQATQLYNKIA